MPTEIDKLSLGRFTRALSNRAGEFGIRLRKQDIDGLTGYYALLSKWNSRLHLVAPCSPEQFATRHILESLLLLGHLPPDARVADVGSGAGLPIIPCLIVRQDLRAILIESSQKKSVFLRAALRPLSHREPARLLVSRFDDTPVPPVDFVTCRAIERFRQVLPRLIDWAPPAATLLLFAGPDLREQLEGLVPVVQAELIPGSAQRFLLTARL